MSLADTLTKFQNDASNQTDTLRDMIHKERMILAQKVRTQVLLPFCRKHKLTMNINIYDNTFTTVKGDTYSDYELPKHFKDPQAALIEKFLSISYMGDHLFDYHMGCDIAKEDWLLTSPAA